MVQYNRGKIYKLVCNETGLVYIGSTCEKLLCQRLSKHVCDYKRWKDGKYGYTTSYKTIDNGDYYIELIETVPCSGFDELSKKERHYIESVKCVNKVMPGRTVQECKKHHYEVNKQVIAAKLSVKIKCPKCDCEVRKDYLPRHQLTLKCQNTTDTLQELDEITN